MENIPVEIHLLRSLKGPGLSVLMALWLVGSPQNMRWLQRTTGYGDEAVQGALELLAEYNLVARQGRYAWQIAAHGKQLPLAMQVLPGQAAADSVLNGVPPTESGRPDEAEGPGTPEKPESDPGKTGVPCSSSSGLINMELFPEVEPLPRATDTGNSGCPENLAILDEHGIREPARSRLAGLPHVTPRLLEYHLRTAPNTGLAIHRIAANWRVPRDWEVYCPPEVIDLTPLTIPGRKEQENEAEALFDRALAWLRPKMGACQHALLRRLRAAGFDGRRLTLQGDCRPEEAERGRVALRMALEALVGDGAEVEIIT